MGWDGTNTTRQVEVGLDSTVSLCWSWLFRSPSSLLWAGKIRSFAEGVRDREARWSVESNRDQVRLGTVLTCAVSTVGLDFSSDRKRCLVASKLDAVEAEDVAVDRKGARSLPKRLGKRDESWTRIAQWVRRMGLTQDSHQVTVT